MSLASSRPRADPGPRAEEQLFIEDETVLGTAFYLMERGEGRTFHDAAAVGREGRGRSVALGDQRPLNLGDN